MSGPQYSGPHLAWPHARKVAEALLKARRDSHRPAGEVAAAVGWSGGRLWLKEQGRSRMREDEALALAAVLGVDAQELGLEGET